jgi:succinoglycan biosynthesis transport protein ExoP
MNPDPVAPPTARDYLRILGRRWWVVVLGIVGFTVLGVAYSYKGPTIYKASSEVRFTSGNADLAVNSGNHAAASTASQEVLTEVEVIKAPNFKNKILADLHLEPKAIKQANITNVINTNAIKITIGTAKKDLSVQVADQYAKVYVASVQAQQAALTKQQTASTLAQLNAVKAQVTSLQTALSNEAKRIDGLDAAAVAAGNNPPETSPTLIVLQAQLAALTPTYTTLQEQYGQLLVDNATSQPTVRQIADAQLPKKASQPQPVKYGIVGLVLGIIFGIAGAYVFELLTDKVRSRQDVERFSRLPVLAMVPRRGSRGSAGQPIALEEPASEKAEAYRAARAGVQFLSLRMPMRRILVAGLRPADGQDVAAANLAVTLAAAGSRVVVVDCDLRGGQLHERFGLARGNGLTSVLLGDTALADALRPVEVPGGALRVLATGPLPPNPADLVASDSLTGVLAKLAEGADFVVVSSPPLLPYNDALALSRHADGVIMVATARRTRRRELADGAAKLRRVNAPAVGVVLDRGTRGADAYETSVGRIRIGDEVSGDAQPGLASS